MFAKLLICGTTLVGLVAGQASAQYHHASTVYEGALRGEADYMRSWALANYWSSLANWQDAQATREWQLAERERLELRWQSQDDHRARQCMNVTRLTTDEYADIAQKTAPQRLNEVQFDRTDGRIHWPRVLRGPRYANLTHRLNTLMDARCELANTEVDAQDRDIDQVATELLDLVKADVHRFRGSKDYTTARKFVEGLIREVRSGNA